MTFDPNRMLHEVADHFGNMWHPAVPEVKVKDYEAFARVAAKLFQEPQPQHAQVQQAPVEFERLWDIAKPLANRLLGRDPTMPELVMQANREPSQIQAYYVNHPHPHYSESTAGEMARYAAAVEPVSSRTQGRPPNEVETHRFVQGGYTMDDVVAHYMDKG
jgi:hypothetical protein